jgi:secondary thiamine-phosphate synthase enzyme
MQARYEERRSTRKATAGHRPHGASAEAIDNAGIADGLCTVFVAHSTCGMTTIECEPGCSGSQRRPSNASFPRRIPGAQRRNADTNGHSHARAALIGPSVTVPMAGGELLLGVWQKIVCVDFDDRPRTRRVVVQLIGE